MGPTVCLAIQHGERFTGCQYSTKVCLRNVLVTLFMLFVFLTIPAERGIVFEMDENLLKRRVGANIRRAREAKGLNQEALARAVGYSRASITNIELGNQNVNLQTLYQLAAVLGVEPASLLPVPPGREAPVLNRERLAELTKRYVKRENESEEVKKLP